ncbi:MAG: hypothetical protein Q8P20_00175 [bacterium]|nr:hypothetical protein [bacterium]
MTKDEILKQWKVNYKSKYGISRTRDVSDAEILEQFAIEFNAVNKKLAEVDSMAMQLEDVLHGNEGKQATSIRHGIIEIKNIIRWACIGYSRKDNYL